MNRVTLEKKDWDLIQNVLIKFSQHGLTEGSRKMVSEALSVNPIFEKVEKTYHADFLWPVEDDTLESYLYEFANAKTEGYQRVMYLAIKNLTKGKTT